MKIAMIGYFGWYGSMAEWVADAWENNGHDVIKFDRKLIPQELDKSFDFIFIVDCSEDFSRNIPRYIQPTVFWSYDAHMPGGAERSVNIARKSDLIFSMNYLHGVKLLAKFGVKSFWMPSTYNDLFICDGEKLHLDVAMIGNANSHARIELWKLLNENYKAFTGKAETKEEYKHAMSNSNIIVNQPTEPWDIITGIRFFEALGFGKLCLQKRIKTDELEKLGFIDGVDFVYWDNFEDLKTKIDYYLKNDHERQKISISGNKKVYKMSMTAQAAKQEQIILSELYEKL